MAIHLPRGRHLAAEFIGVSQHLLDDEALLKEVCLGAAKASKNTPLSTHSHKFEPYGVSVYILLAESHITIHTWPEWEYCSVDIYTCGEGDPLLGLIYLQDRLNPKQVDIRLFPRGMFR